MQPSRFNAVSSVNSSIFVRIKHNTVNNPKPHHNHSKTQIFHKKEKETKENKRIQTDSQSFSQKYSISNNNKKTHLKNKKTKSIP